MFIIVSKGDEKMEYAKIILEMLERIKTLEGEVAELKAIHATDSTEKNHNQIANIVPLVKTNKRDTTRYIFEGNVFLKNRLVLAVVQSFVRNNPNVTRLELKTIFDKSLQGSIGVVENKEIAEQRKDYEVRFFTKKDETIVLNDGIMYVCTQWGILNIPNFVRRAEQLGFEILPVV